jgi:hypothetical protein
LLWHEPPFAVEPLTVKSTPVPHPLMTVCTAAHASGAIWVLLHGVEQPVVKSTVSAPQVEPVGGSQEQPHCAGAADGESPPWKVAR